MHWSNGWSHCDHSCVRKTLNRPLCANKEVRSKLISILHKCKVCISFSVAVADDQLLWYMVVCKLCCTRPLRSMPVHAVRPRLIYLWFALHITSHTGEWAPCACAMRMYGEREGTAIAVSVYMRWPWSWTWSWHSWHSRQRTGSQKKMSWI